MAIADLNSAMPKPFLIAGGIAGSSLFLSGFAYADKTSMESVPTVLQVDDRTSNVQTFPMLVKDGEAGMNYLAKEEKNQNGWANAILGNNAALAGLQLHFGNLHQNITEDDLWEICCSFGEVIQILLRDDEPNERKRVAIVTYADNESASACLNKMDGLIVADNTLAVSLCKPDSTTVSSPDSSFCNWAPDDDERTGGTKPHGVHRSSRTENLGGAPGNCGGGTIGPTTSYPGLTSSVAAAATSPTVGNIPGGDDL